MSDKVKTLADEYAAALADLEQAKSRADKLWVALQLAIKEPPPPPPPPKPAPVIGVSPFAIVYGNLNNVPKYAKPGALLIAGTDDDTTANVQGMQDARKGGAEIFQYIVPNDWPTKGYGDKFREKYFGGFPGGPAYWPFANRSKWPNTRMADMRPGSAWIKYTVDFIEREIIRPGKADGVFLDTVGARTWAKGANWESWPIAEKDAYMLGNIDLVRRLDERCRAIGRPDFLRVSNSLWWRADKESEAAEGEKFVHGVCLEHHVSTSKFHRNYAARKFMGENRRMLVIANSQDEARAWANVPGVTHVSGQTSKQYTNPLEPPFAFRYVPKT